MLDAIRWVRTVPLAADRFCRTDIFEWALFSVLKGFATGLAVNILALLIGISIRDWIRPVPYETYGYESLAVVLDFGVLFSGPVIGLVGGVMAARQLRRGRAGLAVLLAVWIAATAVGVAVMAGIIMLRTQDMTVYDLPGAVLFAMNIILMHGTLIGLYFWRRVIRVAEAELLSGFAPPRFQLKTLRVAALGLLLSGVAFWTLVFLETL